MEQFVRTIDPRMSHTPAPARAHGATSPASELYGQWGEKGFDTDNLTFSTGYFMRVDRTLQNRSNFIEVVYIGLKVKWYF
jgi:hypothetical protein